MSFKHLQKLSNNAFLANAPKNLNRIYCSDNKPNKVFLKNAESLENKDSTNEPNKIVVDNEGDKLKIVVIPKKQDILKQVLTEKEKDACVRSRLSKECTHLLHSHEQKIGVDSNFTNILKEQHEQKCSNWEDYGFRHALLKDAKHYSSDYSCPEVSSNDKTVSKSSSDSGTASSPPSNKSQPPSGGSEPPGQAAPPRSTRIVRGEPGEVIGAWIPVGWWQFFLPKTGVTGFGTFLVTFGTYVCSKEILVMEHNYYNGLSSVLLLALTIKYVGAKLAKFLDKEIDEYEAAWNKGRNDSKAMLEEQMLQEKFLQFQAEGQTLLIAAKRENVQLQLEEAYRLRLMYAYNQVKQILDYHVAVASVYMKIQQKNLVQYVQKEVLKSVTPEMQNKLIYFSIENMIEEMDKQSIGTPKGQDPPKDPPKGQGGAAPQTLAPKSEKKKPDDKTGSSKPDDPSKKGGKK